MASLTSFVSEETLPSGGASERDGRRPAPPASSLFPAGSVANLRVTDGGDLQAASFGWDVRYAQLGAGRCRGRQVTIHTARLQLSLEAWSPGILETGRPPQGTVTFLVPVGRSGAVRIQGRSVAAGDVVVSFDGDELDYRSGGPAQVVTVSLARRALEGHVRALLGRHLGELRLQGRLNGLRTDHRALLRLFNDIAARTAVRPRLLRDTHFARGLEANVVRILLSEFDAPRKPPAPSRGRTLARKAEAWLRQHLAEPPTIAALCGALRASERTLHEAFREHLGTTPKAYLKTLRLNAARRDLRKGVVKTRVTDVALDWGFLHFGWFSQDYRRLFGETPSQTLHRSRAETGHRLAKVEVSATSAVAGRPDSVASRVLARLMLPPQGGGDSLVIRSRSPLCEEGPCREQRP